MATGGSGGAGPMLAPVPIRAHERITYGTDSLSVGYNGQPPWPTGAGNFFDQVNAILGAGNEVVGTAVGKPGTGIIYLRDHLQSLIFDNDPTLVMLNVGINDARAPVENFLDEYANVLARIKAWKPTVKMLCIGLGPLEAEYWTFDSAGKAVWNPAQPSINTYDNYIRQAATAMGCMFVDWRQFLLAWEVIHNPGQQVLGFATIDGTHYTDAGQKQLAAAILQPSICTVSP
jgi:lysophospholipase L1-like esterase